ncbi:DUF1642 domain-containing protein [Carnobacterium pleistocenium]|uniref:DUF1642 domain-containing protein n=1 Tax=Carnobacterium pleistocenium TaxID=181073 RepID=UPI00068A03D5|nr:DUF1642 domain-containing protein [Carnobacterium pleistocenium]
MNKQELIKCLDSAIDIGEKQQDDWNKGYVMALYDYKDLVRKLREPELPVIPQFIADYLDDFKKQNLTLGDALDTHFEDDKQIHAWLYEDGEVRNDEAFARAWLDDYTIEKEKLYKVVLTTSEGRVLAKTIPDNIVFISHVMDDGNKHSKKKFTEQEIKAIDERYWAFAEEVPNV